MTSMTPDAPTDDSFADAGALDESTVVDDDDKRLFPDKKINVVKSGVSLETPTRPRLDLARPPPLAPPLTPPSPLAPGSSRARSCPTRSDGRKDLTSPATAFRRRKAPPVSTRRRRTRTRPSARAGATRTTRRRGARARAAPRRFYAPRGVAPAMTRASPRSRNALARGRSAEEGSGGFQNASRRFSHFGSASARLGRVVAAARGPGLAVRRGGRLRAARLAAARAA